MQSRYPSILRLIFTGLLAFATGCIGTSVGNPPGADSSAVQLGIVGASDVKSATIQSAVGDITIQEAWISVSDIGLWSAGTCSKGEGPIDFEGPVAADLLSGRVLPETPAWMREEGETYCALGVTVRKAGAVVEGAPAELADYGVFVRGERSDGTPFELRSDINDELELGAIGKSAFALDSGPIGLLLTFNLDSWLNPALLNQAVIKNGVIHADKSDNASIAEDAKQKIPGSARLHRDKNRNGELDSDDSDL